MSSYYGTNAGAIAYFDERLNSRIWSETILNDRIKALKMATRAIDKLNIAGRKYDDDQELQFPRYDDTAVPLDIERACYECAYAYLDGIDMELEQKNIGVTSDAFSGARVSYDSNFVEEHIRAGIASTEAWAYLRPYLRNPHTITLRRVP